MESMQVNHLAVFAAALSDFLVGGLWYSPLLFYKAWLQETGLTEDALKARNPAKTFGFTFVFALVISYNLAFFLGGDAVSLAWAIGAALLAGIGWATMGLLIISLFEVRTWRYMFIHAGYLAVAFGLKGVILGLWR